MWETIHNRISLQIGCYTTYVRYGAAVGRRQRVGRNNWTSSFPPSVRHNHANMSTKAYSTYNKDTHSTKGVPTFEMKLPLTRPIHYSEAPVRTTSIYPSPEFTSMVHGRHKRAIGSLFGIHNFGMNATTLQPMEDTTTKADAADVDDTSKSASSSSIVHYHTKQDEMIYIVSGTATLLSYDVDTNSYEDILMTAGDVMGFPAGRTIGHSICNMSTTEPLTILEIGDRTKYDTAIYPEPSIDLCAKQMDDDDDLNVDETNVKNKGTQYRFFHKDGRPY